MPYNASGGSWGVMDVMFQKNALGVIYITPQNYCFTAYNDMAMKIGRYAPIHYV